MLIIDVNISGLDLAEARLRAFAQGAWKRGLMQAAATTVEGQTKRRIAAEKTSPDGGAWAPWSASYVESGRHGGSLLVRTGRLLGSITHVVSGDTALVGTNVAYAGFLQFGTRKMPARPFLGISAANQSELERVVEAFVRRAFA